MSGAVLDVTTDGEADGAIEKWRSLIGPRLLVAAVIAWLWSLIGVDLRAMTDVGLLSVLPPSFFVALTLLTVGFLFVIEYRAEHRILVGAYLVLFAAMVHATPALLYGTVRYSWSYKHLGVVEFGFDAADQSRPHRPNRAAVGHPQIQSAHAPAQLFASRREQHRDVEIRAGGRANIDAIRQRRNERIE